MAEKKVILQIEIQEDKAITGVVQLKNQIKTLKEEQSKLNAETLEGQKQFEAYNAQIKALTKEQKNLEKSIEATASGMQKEAGSIAHNRTELARLKAEYLNLANPTKEQTQAILDLTNKLKEQEAAIGDTRRNVGNYQEAMQGALGVTGVFGQQVQGVIQGFGTLKGSIGTLVKGFSTLRGAIIGTGIGALVVALGSLIAYMQTTDTGSTKLAGVMGALGAVMKRITGFFSELGDMLTNVTANSFTLQDAIKGVGDFILNFFTNRINGAIQTFQALMDAVNEISENGLDAELGPSIQKATDGVIQMSTGVKDATKTLSALADEMITAAKAAYEYAVAVDAIDDAQRDLNIQNAKAEQQVAILIKQSKNRTLADEQRIAILKQANAIDEAAFLRQNELDKQRLKLVEDRNKRELLAINQRNAALVEELNSAETSATRKLEIQEKLLAIEDDLAQEEADLRVKVIKNETAFLALREKNQNTIDALNEKIAADREKALQEQYEREKRIQDALANLETQRLAQKIKNIDYELSQEGISLDRRIELINQRAQLELEIERKLLAEKVSDEKLITEERTALIEASAAREIEIENEKNKMLKAAMDKQALEEKKILDNKAKAFQDQLKKYQTFIALAQQALSAASTINSAQEQEKLDNLEQQRKEALERAGDDKKRQEAINKKFDARAEDIQRKSAKRSMRIQQLQAVAAGANAVVQALANPPGPPISTIFAVAAGSLAAIQIGVLQSQISKLKKGGLIPEKLATGGVVNGPSHEQGGVRGTGRFANVEVEGGEFVVNKHATKMFMPQLKYINSFLSPANRPAFKRPVMALGGQLDGGLSSRVATSGLSDNIQLQQVLTEVVRSIPAPVVVVDDINRGQQKLVQVRSRADIS